MLDWPQAVQDPARPQTGHGRSPDDQGAELGCPSVTRRRPLDDWTATQIAWPVEDRDLVSANR